MVKVTIIKTCYFPTICLMALKIKIDIFYMNGHKKEFDNTKGADRNQLVRRQTRPWPIKYIEHTTIH